MDVRGFSLLELLVYIALISIITVILSSIFISVNWGKGNIEARVTVGANLRIAAEKINQDLRAASSVSIPSVAGATSTVLSMTIGSSTIQYDVVGGQLRRQFDSSTPQFITDDIVEVNTTTNPIIFTRLENINTVFLPPKKAVSIQYTMFIRYKSDSRDWRYSENKVTSVMLR